MAIDTEEVTQWIVRLSHGEGRAVRPTLAARKVHIEIDLALGK